MHPDSAGGKTRYPVHAWRRRLHLYNHDIRSFIRSYMPQYIDRGFIYLDPPYFQKGKYLYKNFFTTQDHQEIHDLIIQLKCPWMVTYDNAPEIRGIYQGLQVWQFDLVYGAANSGLNSEILYISDEKLLPVQMEKKQNKINLRKQEDSCIGNRITK